MRRRQKKAPYGGAEAPSDSGTPQPSKAEDTASGDAAAAAVPPVQRQLSTSLSDLVLAAASFYGAYLLIEAEGRKRFVNPNSAIYVEGLFKHLIAKGGARFFAAIAFGLIGVAASWGVFRFARMQWAMTPHEFFTTLALFVSTPMLGLCTYTRLATLVPALAPSFLHLSGGSSAVSQFLYFGLLFFVLNFLLLHGILPYATGLDAKQAYTLVTGALAMVTMIYLGIVEIMMVKDNPVHPREGRYIIAGAVLYVISGTAVGSAGHYLGIIPRVDIFHLALTIANLLLAIAFSVVLA